MKTLKPKDAVAIITLLFIFSFKFYGFDGALDSALALILGYYFAKRSSGLDEGK